MAGIDETLLFQPLKLAVLTVSDTRTTSDDRSGDTLAARIIAAGHDCVDRAIIRDDIAAIQTAVTGWVAAPDIDAIITTGGTGLTGRDVTVEAVMPMLDKVMDGFSVLFHQISFRSVGLSTIQSRACAGRIGDTLIFCLPGSTGAVRDGWDGIIGPMLDSRYRPCSLVDLIPRFTE